MDQRKKDVENWEHIRKFLIIYLTDIAIPHFEKMKAGKYVKAMENFSYDEMKNAEQHLACWGEFTNQTEDLLMKHADETFIRIKWIEIDYNIIY